MALGTYINPFAPPTIPDPFVVNELDANTIVTGSLTSNSVATGTLQATSAVFTGPGTALTLPGGANAIFGGNVTANGGLRVPSPASIVASNYTIAAPDAGAVFDFSTVVNGAFGWRFLNSSGQTSQLNVANSGSGIGTVTFTMSNLTTPNAGLGFRCGTGGQLVFGGPANILFQCNTSTAAGTNSGLQFNNVTTPTAGATVPTHSFQIALGGTVYRIPCLI